MIDDGSLASSRRPSKEGGGELSALEQRRLSTGMRKDGRRSSNSKELPSALGFGAQLVHDVDKEEQLTRKKLVELNNSKIKLERKIAHAKKVQQRAADGDTNISMLALDPHRLDKLERNLHKMEANITRTEEKVAAFDWTMGRKQVVRTGHHDDEEDDDEAGKGPTSAKEMSAQQLEVARKRRNKNKAQSEFATDAQDFVLEIGDEYDHMQGDVFRETFGGNAIGVNSWLQARNNPNLYHAETGWTPLHIAVSGGHTEIIDLLMHHAADPTKGSQDHGWAPSHLAARKNTCEVLKLLIKLHDRSHKDVANDGSTPLLTAVAEGSPKVRDEMVRLLLEAHAEANAERKDGWNPLSIAVERGFPTSCKLLVQNRGNVFTECPGTKGLSIWQMAAKHPGLQAVIKRKMNSRDVQKLEQQVAKSQGHHARSSD